MIVKHAREIPLFESLGIFTEAPKKKRKPRVISVRPIRKDYTSMVDPDELIDIDDIDSLGDDLSDYDSLDMDIGDDLADDELLNDTPIEGDEDDFNIGQDDIPDDIGEEPIDGDEELPDFEIPEDISFDDLTLDDDQTQNDVPAEEIESPEDQDTSDDDQTVEVPEGETTDTSTDTTEQPAEQPEGEQPTEEIQEGNEVIDATGSEMPEDIGAEVDIAAADGTDSSPVSTDTSVDPSAGTDETSITKDDMRKYELFKRFMNLLNTVQYFIDKLETGVSDNIKFEYAANKALIKFKALEDLLKDYMLLKFQNDSFLQNSFFYEKIKASSLLLLELMNLNKITKDEK